MGKVVEPRSEIARRLHLLRCPRCCLGLEPNDGLRCERCGRNYYDEGLGIVSFLLGRLSSTKEKIQSFWGDIYRQWYESDDGGLNAESLWSQLQLLEDLFIRRRHLAVTEVDLERLGQKEILEIGSGSGGHSALFRKYGAHVTSVDITAERVIATGRKLELLREVPAGSGLALQADAEDLPFRDDAFDLVYSNGVWHHTEQTEPCISEAFRVLKPGGQAIVMLYSRHSANYWLKLLPWAVLSGEIFTLAEAQWLGRLTEGHPLHQAVGNPVTRVFSRRQIERMFRQFKTVTLRKGGFLISHLPVPKIGRYRDELLAVCGSGRHEGGRIVYGRPMVPETKVELWLGRVMGFCWNIKAIKAGKSATRSPSDG